MFIIEEVFLSMDEDSRRKMLEDILVSMIKNSKNYEEPEDFIHENAIEKNM